MTHASLLEDYQVGEPTRRVYIAGPMRGVPELNFPLFDAVARFLDTTWRLKAIINPAQISRDMAHTRGCRIDDIPVEEYMHRDLTSLLGCTDLVLLPNWHYSEGATVEYIVAKAVGLPIYEVTQQEDELLGGKHFFLHPIRMSPLHVMAQDTIREILKGGLAKHAADSWKDEPHENHLLKSSRHAITAHLQLHGLSPKDDEDHHANALTRAAMALWQKREVEQTPPF